MEVYSPTELAAVGWSRRADGLADVRLRRHVRRVEAPGGGEMWRADEQYLVSGLSEAQCAEAFDELWEEAASKARQPRELVEELSGSIASAFGVGASQVGLAARAMAAAFRSMDATDAQAAEFSALWPEWAAGTDYRAGQVLRHGGGLFRVAQDHAASTGHEPGAGTESLYTPIEVGADGVEEWRQPTGAHDAYAEGDVVRDPTDGLEYRSLVDANSWGPPSSFPDYWEPEG